MSDLTPLDRLWQSFRRLVQAEIRAVVGYPGRYEYTIVSSTGSTVDANPTDANTGLPSVSGCPLSSSTIGSLTPPTGKRCHIVFLNGDRRKPSVVWCEPNAGAAIGRVGDSVTVPNLTVVAPGGGGPCMVSQAPGGTNLSGSITSGSSIAGCE